MKPRGFAYHDPRTLAEALSLLAEHGDVGKPLAGGQSLVPLLNFRLAAPEHLIDLNGVGSLAGIRRHDGRLHVGAMTRQSALERSHLVRENWPLLTEALAHLAHPQIRNRGTVGGSVAHADPAAELPVALTALDARFTVASLRGERVIAADELFVSDLTTTLEPDELLVGIDVPPVAPRTGHAFTEHARRHGDFGLAGAAALVTVDEGGTCTRAAIALLAAGPRPIRSAEAERVLAGRPLDETLAAEAAAAAIEDVRPTGDVHASSGYRRHLVGEMVRRAIRDAAARAERAVVGAPA